MADGAPPGGQPARGQRRKIPTIYFVGGAVALVGLYYFYSKSKANAAAAAAAGQAAVAAPASTAAGSYGNAGDLAALAPYLQNLSGPASTSSGATYVAPTGQTLYGGGFGVAPGTTQAPITDANGNQFQALSSNAQIQALAASGQTGWIQSQPGVFLPTTPNQPLPPGTPLYEKIR